MLHIEETDVLQDLDADVSAGFPADVTEQDSTPAGVVAGGKFSERDRGRTAAATAHPGESSA